MMQLVFFKSAMALIQEILFNFRFEKKLYVRLPETRLREKLLKIYMGEELTTLESKDFRNIAELTEGYSNADLYCTVQVLMSLCWNLAMP